MYSSLHRVDIVVKREGGGELFVQTDHRTPSEVEEDLDVSVLFALTRSLVPKRNAKSEASVRYVCLETMHPSLVEVVASCGAEAESAGKALDLSAVARKAPADLADAAFASLGKRVLARENLPTSEQGLRALVESMAKPPTMDEDEIGYYTAVVELAAATGEVLRETFGGRWVDDPSGFADVPFMFGLASHDGSRLNAVGKSIKYFLHGEAESPVYLLRAAEDTHEEAGPLLVSLKPSDWGMRAEMVQELLAPELESAGADVPLVAYGHDRPNTFAMIKKDAPDTPSLATLREEALRNLRDVPVQIEKVALAELTFYVVYGSYFAGEKILDQPFMHELHERIGAPLLAAAVPEKGRMFVTSALAPASSMLAFIALANGTYSKNEGGRQISPTVFMLSEGRIVGVAKPGEPEPEPKKGFFGRLFGKN